MHQDFMKAKHVRSILDRDLNALDMAFSDRVEIIVEGEVYPDLASIREDGLVVDLHLAWICRFGGRPGDGLEAMNELFSIAQKHQADITLNVAQEKRGFEGRLKQYYMNLGFVDHPSQSSSMIRHISNHGVQKIRENVITDFIRGNHRNDAGDLNMAM